MCDKELYMLRRLLRQTVSGRMNWSGLKMVLPMLSSMLLHMYIHVGSICSRTPLVVKVARMIAKTMVIITSENTIDSTVLCRVDRRVFLRIMKGIVVTETC
jgi:hypothetical protein